MIALTQFIPGITLLARAPKGLIAPGIEAQAGSVGEWQAIHAMLLSLMAQRFQPKKGVR